MLRARGCHITQEHTAYSREEGPNAKTFPADQKLGLGCAGDLAYFNRHSTIIEDQLSGDGDPGRGACDCRGDIDPGQPIGMLTL